MGSYEFKLSDQYHTGFPGHTPDKTLRMSQDSVPISGDVLARRWLWKVSGCGLHIFTIYNRKQKSTYIEMGSHETDDKEHAAADRKDLACRGAEIHIFALRLYTALGLHDPLIRRGAGVEGFGFWGLESLELPELQDLARRPFRPKPQKVKL